MKKIDLIRLADALAGHRGLALSTLSTYVAGDGKFFPRLKSGRCGCTMDRGESLAVKLSGIWPADLAWPADIPRPAATPDAKVA